MSGSYLGHEYLVRMLGTNIWFIFWTRMSASYVGHEYLVSMLDTNIWFVCWTRISGSYARRTKFIHSQNVHLMTLVIQL